MAAGSSVEETDKLVGKYSQVDEYGFKRDKDFDFKSYENFISEYNRVLVHRALRWNKLLNDGKKTKVKRDTKVKRFCRKGVPLSHRPMVWMNVSGAQKRMKKHPGLYEKILAQNETSTEDKDLRNAIETDIDRTFPENLHFYEKKSGSGKRESLTRVLTAIGRYKKEIGYCQGMNYVAAMLLLIIHDEESVFWLFVAVLEDVLPDYYSNDMIGLRTDMEVLSALVKERNPVVSACLERESINFLLLSSKWFICLYIDILPTETVLRIWDVLFTEGSKILFRVALRLIQLRTNKIRQATDMPGIISALSVLKKEDEVLECHNFMQQCFKEETPLRMAQIKKLRKEIEEKLRQEEAERLEKRRQKSK